jgi:hypothetical protein
MFDAMESFDHPARRYFVVLTVIVAVGLAHVIFRRRPLASIPGPLLARFSPLWLVYHSRKGDMHRVMIELHRRYGKLVRIGPNEVSVSDLEAVKKIYGS